MNSHELRSTRWTPVLLTSNKRCIYRGSNCGVSTKVRALPLSTPLPLHCIFEINNCIQILNFHYKTCFNKVLRSEYRFCIFQTAKEARSYIGMLSSLKSIDPGWNLGKTGVFFLSKLNCGSMFTIICMSLHWWSMQTRQAWTKNWMFRHNGG